MPHKVEFYIKKPENAQSISDLVLSKMPKSIYIHCQDLTHAQTISHHLWSYPKDRFIPNVINTSCPLSVIQIGYTDIPKDREVIINAANTFIKEATIEWVCCPAPSSELIAARKRYRLWQQQGIPITLMKDPD